MATLEAGQVQALTLSNRQRSYRVNLPALRRVVRCSVQELLGLAEFQLEINLVTRQEITQLNERFLGHAGPTDVITFDYSQPADEPGSGVDRRSQKHGRQRPQASGSSLTLLDHTAECRRLHGEIFVCVDEAVAQARKFRTTWTSELVRYVVHGILHLLGFDDARPAQRRRMKRAQDRVVRALARRFHFAGLTMQKRRVRRDNATRI